MDTIFALSSGKLPSGVAVIRVSGNEVQNIIKSIRGKVPPARMMAYGSLYSLEREFLDSALTVFFPTPNSFTGEDCVEFHLHGGKAVVARFLNELSKFDNCRIAEAGEFSKRAFVNGKLDLTEAEGLADLIDAETESQRRLAVMGASGALAELYREWRQELLQARAMVEAELDFVEEQDIPDSVSDQIWDKLKLLSLAIKKHVADGYRAQTMRDGIKIVIAGAPNSGKSSIINRLAGRDVAIVTDEEGTTRDALEIRLMLAGLPVLITDTAGIRETANKVEKIGINTALKRLQEADLILHIEDMSSPVEITLPVNNNAEIWRLGNKVDLVSGDDSRWPIQFSAETGVGFEEFLNKLIDFCNSFSESLGDLVPARKRQFDLLEEAISEIDSALILKDLDLTLRAEHLRRASDMLGRITGDIDVEDILDVIFSQFCVGK